MHPHKKKNLDKLKISDFSWTQRIEFAGEIATWKNGDTGTS